jgi:hypothetical protein
MIALTLITSKTVITKKFRLRGQALEKERGGTMFAGHAEALEVPDLQALIPVINGMSTRQALAYGTITVPGDRHRIVTKDHQIDGQTISRSRKFFEFRDGQEGIILIDYDPPKTEKPLAVEDVMQMLVQVCPALASSEKLIVSSASSYLYRKSDNVCLKAAGGLHILVRVQNSAEIPGIGKSLNARLWLSGFGYIGKTEDGKDQVRSLIDTSVWQPERLSYECGSECGSGLEQRKPAIQHAPGGSLSLEDVEISAEDWDKYNALVAAAKGQKPPKKSASRTRNHGTRATAAKPATQATATAEPLTPAKAAKIMGALMCIPVTVDYDVALRIGMALKTECGEAGLDLWNSWFSVSPHYHGPAYGRAKFASFDRRDVTIKTLYFYAKSYGWEPNPKKKALDELCPLPVLALPEAAHEPLIETVGCGKAYTSVLQSLYKNIVSDPVKNLVSAAQITTGVGKTSAVRTLIEDIKRAGQFVTIVAKDKQQCREYEQAGAFWRHGRELTEEGFTARTPWHCPKAGSDGPVARLGEKEHRLQQMCKSGHCEHGNVMMLARAEATGRQASQAVIQFFKERPDLRNADPCAWFDHNDHGKKLHVRVVTAAGLNAADLVTDDNRPIDHLIVDESVQWSHSQFLDLSDIRKAIEALTKVTDQAKELAPSAGFGVHSEPEIAEALAGPLAAFRILAEAMGKHAATAAKGAYTAIDFDLSGIITDLSDGTDENGSALWEKPAWQHWTELLSVPLRALAAIQEGVKAGSLSMVDGRLHVTYLHTVLTEARSKGISVTVLDATLDETAKAIVGQDNIQHIAARPNLTWKVDPRWFKGAKNRPDDLRAEALLVLCTRKKMEKETRHGSYVICRKQLALDALAVVTKMKKSDILAMSRDELWSLSVEKCIGWWGWHDVAHDEWHGLNGLLWGQIPIPDDVRLQEYMDHRACLLMLGKVTPGDLPMADNKWTQGQQVCTGTQTQTSLARLPDQRGDP